MGKCNQDVHIAKKNTNHKYESKLLNPVVVRIID